MNRDMAVALAIKDCIREGIFADFVTKYGSEVENMLFTQFNMDDALAVRYEEGVEDGMEQGIEQGIEKGIEQGIEEKGIRIFLNLLGNGMSRTDAQRLAEIDNSLAEKALKLHKF